jgi:hypothetical protein
MQKKIKSEQKFQQQKRKQYPPKNLKTKPCSLDSVTHLFFLADEWRGIIV